MQRTTPLRVFPRKSARPLGGVVIALMPRRVAQLEREAPWVKWVIVSAFALLVIASVGTGATLQLRSDKDYNDLKVALKQNTKAVTTVGVSCARTPKPVTNTKTVVIIRPTFLTAPPQVALSLPTPSKVPPPAASPSPAPSPIFYAPTVSRSPTPGSTDYSMNMTVGFPIGSENDLHLDFCMAALTYQLGTQANTTAIDAVTATWEHCDKPHHAIIAGGKVIMPNITMTVSHPTYSLIQQGKEGLYVATTFLFGTGKSKLTKRRCVYVGQYLNIFNCW